MISWEFKGFICLVNTELNGKSLLSNMAYMWFKKNYSKSVLKYT